MTKQEIEYRFPEFGNFSTIVIQFGWIILIGSIIFWIFFGEDKSYFPFSFLLLSIHSMLLGIFGNDFSKKDHQDYPNDDKNTSLKRFRISLVIILIFFLLVVSTYDENMMVKYTIYKVLFYLCYAFVFCYGIFFIRYLKNHSR